MIIDKFLFTHPGSYSVNEDCIGFSLSENGAIFVLADGLGGCKNGDIASKKVVETINNEFSKNRSELSEEWLDSAIRKANDEVFQLQLETHNKMKSTVAALIISPDKAVFANVGDSRVYFISNDAFDTITKDHSVAYKKYIAGEITREQIGIDEDQSSLLRTLGNEECANIDAYSVELSKTKNEAFFLCSDGFWENVRDDEILFEYLKADSAKAWADNLLLKVKQRMPEDNDNLSCICVIYHK